MIFFVMSIAYSLCVPNISLKCPKIFLIFLPPPQHVHYEQKIFIYVNISYLESDVIWCQWCQHFCHQMTIHFLLWLQPKGWVVSMNVPFSYLWTLYKCVWCHKMWSDVIVCHDLSLNGIWWHLLSHPLLYWTYPCNSSKVCGYYNPQTFWYLFSYLLTPAIPQGAFAPKKLA